MADSAWIVRVSYGPPDLRRTRNRKFFIVQAFQFQPNRQPQCGQPTTYSGLPLFATCSACVSQYFPTVGSDNVRSTAKVVASFLHSGYSHTQRDFDGFIATAPV